MVTSLVKTILKNSLITLIVFYDLNEKSLLELTHDYETAVVSLVEKLEARFMNLHPTIPQLFFKLESMEKGEDKDFLLKTLLMKFDDIAREAR